MTASINMRRAVRRIRLDDEPGSPEFMLDLTDAGMQAKAVPMAGACAVYQKAVEDMQAGDLGDGMKRRVAAIYRVIVDVMLGEGAFETILEWTAGPDEPPENVTMAFAPLIVYLVNEYEAMMTANRNEAVARYLDGLGDADAL